MGEGSGSVRVVGIWWRRGGGARGWFAFVGWGGVGGVGGGGRGRGRGGVGVGLRGGRLGGWMGRWWGGRVWEVVVFRG